MKKHIELETVGTVLKEEFIEPYNLTIEQVANAKNGRASCRERV